MTRIATPARSRRAISSCVHIGVVVGLSLAAACGGNSRGVEPTTQVASTDTPTSASDTTAPTRPTSSADTPTTAAEPTGGSSTTITPSTIAPTTAAPTSTTTSDPRPLALDVLATIPITSERGDGYVRELFRHWITQPSGCSTREAVLIRDTIGLPQVDPFGCTVVAGDWISPYDGARWEFPSDVDIDHVVALKEAWDSGAWAWSDARRQAFANDLTDRRTLRAVTDDVNQSKADKDPSNWMPPLESYWCTYLGDWVAIKARWGLSMDESEYGRARNLLRDRCAGWRIDPITPSPA
ncbi:MAG: DUF1524 domain-containing protein [Ilumatobacteraceae bacterium]